MPDSSNVGFHKATFDFELAGFQRVDWGVVQLQLLPQYTNLNVVCVIRARGAVKHVFGEPSVDETERPSVVGQSV